MRPFVSVAIVKNKKSGVILLRTQDKAYFIFSRLHQDDEESTQNDEIVAPKNSWEIRRQKQKNCFGGFNDLR